MYGLKVFLEELHSVDHGVRNARTASFTFSIDK